MKNNPKYTLQALLFGLLIFLFVGAMAQNSFHADPISGKIKFQTIYKLNNGVNTEETFSLLQNWANQNSAEFNRSNIHIGNNSSKSLNQIQMENVFENKSPLQSIDPESNRLLVKCISKYTGNKNGIIQIMYLEYYLIATIENNEVNIEASNFTYTHVNQRTYNPAQIYTWTSGKPFDSADNLESLFSVGNTNSADFSTLGSYVETDVNTLLSDFSNFMNNNISSLTASAGR